MLEDGDFHNLPPCSQGARSRQQQRPPWIVFDLIRLALARLSFAILRNLGLAQFEVIERRGLDGGRPVFPLRELRRNVVEELARRVTEFGPGPSRR